MATRWAVDMGRRPHGRDGPGDPASLLWIRLAAGDAAIITTRPRMTSDPQPFQGIAHPWTFRTETSVKDQRSGDRNPRGVFKVGGRTPHTGLDAHAVDVHHQAGGNGTAANVSSAGVTPVAERDAVSRSPEPGAPSREDWTRAMRLVHWYLGGLSAPTVPGPGSRPAGPTDGHVAINRGCDEG